MTMLCDACNEALKSHPSMAVFLNLNAPVESRRHAATVLLSLARSRTRQNRGR